MNRWMMGMTGLAIAAAMLAAPMFSVAAEKSKGVMTGDKAPAFTVKDSQGKSHSLSDFAGKTVILEWTNKDCPFVKKFYDAGKMQEWQAAYTAKPDVVWLTICSSAEGNQGYMTADEWNSHVEKQQSKSTAVLLDTDGTVGKAYAAKTTPHIYVIDGEGTLRYQGAIDSIKSAKADDIAKATNYLAMAVDAVLAGSEVSPDTTESYGCGVKY